MLTLVFAGCTVPTPPSTTDGGNSGNSSKTEDIVVVSREDGSGSHLLN